MDDLWALGLAHLSTLHEYERAVNEKARLAGRTLEPWRAILAVALWLEDHDPQNLLRRTTRRLREDGYSLEITENGLWERLDGDPNSITHRHIGRVLGRMRLAKAPRPGGQGSRRWKVTLRDLERWTMAYGLPLPAILAPEDPAAPPPRSISSISKA